MRLGLLICLCLSGFGTSGLASDRPTVILYTTAGCRPCQQALESLRELSIDLRVTRDCPAWVTQVPTIHWRDTSGIWRQHAPQHWSGPTWTEVETAKIRRWLLIDSAKASTQHGGYLTVTSDSLPAPYYQRGPVTLYHGDCLELLPHLPRVDAVVTDPPYGIGDRWNGGQWQTGCGKGRLWNGIPKWDMETADISFLDLSIPTIVWGGNYFACLPPRREWLIWDKTADCVQAQAEMAWTNCAPTVRIFRKSPLGVFGNAGKNSEFKHHPTQKPVELIEWCLSFLPKAESVLDHYLGSGTTAVACIRTGRSCIGIELEEKYCEIAAKRCDRELDQGRLPFDTPKRTETQRELFAEVSSG